MRGDGFARMHQLFEQGMPYQRELALTPKRTVCDEERGPVTPSQRLDQHQRGFYAALVAWAITDVAVLAAFAL